MRLIAPIVRPLIAQQVAAVKIQRFNILSRAKGLWLASHHDGSTTLKDLSGRLNHAAITDAVYTVPAAGAPYFAMASASSQYLTVNHTTDLDFQNTEDFTVVWCGQITGVASAAQSLISKRTVLGSEATGGYALSRQTNDKVRFSIGGGFIFSTNALAVDTTYVVIGRYNATLGNIGLFVNGVGAATTVTVTSPLTSDTTNLRMGRISGTGTTNYLDGTFHGAAIFDRMLTIREITEVVAEFEL